MVASLKQEMVDKITQYQSSNNPFEKDGDNLYIKFDSIVIENTQDGHGVNVVFNLNNQSTVTMRVDGIRFTAENKLCIDGIEARQKVTIF